MSGRLDEDTARALQTGRASVGALLRTAQKRLQRVFIAFIVGLLVGIFAMRRVVWPQLKADLLARGATVIAQTPFDVILLQVKIGLIVGVLVAIPVLLFEARGPLADRGVIQRVEVSRFRAALVAMMGTVLFVVGVVYAYFVFFPVMFTFLARNAQNAGFATMYSIVHWTQFIVVLALSFGLAAQLPLAMTALSYSGVVPYEAFRDYWRYAVVCMFGFGALFSPPDPFTQMMWALPLVALYGFSLYLSKVVVTMKRAGDQVDLAGLARRRWNHVAGAGVLAGLAGLLFARYGGLAAVDGVLRWAGSSYRFGGTSEAAVALAFAAVGTVGAVLYLVYGAIERAAATGRPTPIDVGALDAEGVRAAPPEAFAALSEDEALALANEALDDGQKAKARAVLDRWDEAQGGEDDDGEESSAVQDTAAGMVDAFTDEETTSDDIGGYFYDLRFIVDSLRSRLFRIVAVFLVVMGGSFIFLYRGGIGVIRRDFLTRMPADVDPEKVQIITLHPVEALVFEVKFSVLVGIIVTVPLVVYYAWPAVSERGVAGGGQRTLGVWGGTVLLGLVLGSAVGYAFVAPTVISYLAYDALREGYVIAYRVNNFFWLVFMTTAGIGLLADIPLTMALFHRGNVVTYPTFRRAWRGVALVAFVVGALITPSSLWTLLIVAVPIVVAYWIGLGVLWLGTTARDLVPRQRGTAE